MGRMLPLVAEGFLLGGAAHIFRLRIIVTTSGPHSVSHHPVMHDVGVRDGFHPHPLGGRGDHSYEGCVNAKERLGNAKGT